MCPNFRKAPTAILTAWGFEASKTLGGNVFIMIGEIIAEILTLLVISQVLFIRKTVFRLDPVFCSIEDFTLHTLTV